MAKVWSITGSGNGFGTGYCRGGAGRGWQRGDWSAADGSRLVSMKARSCGTIKGSFSRELLAMPEVAGGEDTGDGS